MATWTSKIRTEAVDGTTIRANQQGVISSVGFMEPFSAGTKNGAPSIWYVDLNVVSSGGGRSWATAFKTLTEGLAAAQAYQSTSGNLAYAHRSIIYVVGDKLDEDLVILAEKTDVIGVGSCNNLDKPTLLGNHVPVTTTTGGCRFFNFHFEADAIGILWDLTGVSTGIKFINCDFSARGENVTSAIRMAACSFVEIAHCRFFGQEDATYPSVACIDILAGNAEETYIHDNFLVGKIGVRINASTTTGGGTGNIRIENNTIHAATYCIDDNSSKVLVVGNTMMTQGRREEAIDINIEYAANNTLKHEGGEVNIPYRDDDGYCANATATRGARGKSYFVDTNMTDDNGDGRTWETAKQLLASAIALSAADVTGSARNWCSQNTIYYQGDFDTTGEDLVALAKNTDIVGCGSYSSYAGMAVLKGHHTISGVYPRARFYNIVFLQDGTSPMITLPADNDGVEFHKCIFAGAAGVAIGIQSTENQNLIVEDCRFIGLDQTACFSTACIYIGSGDNNTMLIRNNIMLGGNGLVLHATQTGLNIWAIGNYIRTEQVCIDDDSNELLTADNKCISTGTLSNAFDGRLGYALGNIVSGKNDDTAWVKELNN